MPACPLARVTNLTATRSPASRTTRVASPCRRPTRSGVVRASGTRTGRASSLITGTLCCDENEKARRGRIAVTSTASKDAGSDEDPPPGDPDPGTRTNEASLRCPGRREGARVRSAGPQHLLRSNAVGLRLPEVGREVSCHFLGDHIRHPQPPPLAAAFLDEHAHGFTSASTASKTASTASRAARHSLTPMASSRRPSGEAR